MTDSPPEPARRWRPYRELAPRASSGGWDLRQALREFSPTLLAMLSARSEFEPHGADEFAAPGRVKRESDLGERIADLAENWRELPFPWRSHAAANLAKELIDRLTTPSSCYELRLLPLDLREDWRALAVSHRELLDPYEIDVDASTVTIEGQTARVRVFWVADDFWDAAVAERGHVAAGDGVSTLDVAAGGGVFDAAANDGPAIRNPSQARINEAITAEYDAAAESGAKPPNIRELARLAQARLAVDGYRTSQQAIADLASLEPHKSRRLRQGVHFRPPPLA